MEEKSSPFHPPRLLKIIAKMLLLLYNREEEMHGSNVSSDGQEEENKICCYSYSLCTLLTCFGIKTVNIVIV